MKRIIFTLSLLFACCALYGQQVFTVVYAVSDDGFVNVRKEASSKSPILAQINAPMYGLDDAILLSDGNPWVKVKVGKAVGYANKNYLGMISWFTGKGKQPAIISNKDNVKIYKEAGEGKQVFTTIGRGVVIADTYDSDGNYYVLETAHDNLYVKKSDVDVSGQGQNGKKSSGKTGTIINKKSKFH